MKKRVLVFPCGTEIGLEINRALRYSTHFELFGGSSVDDHGRFVYKNYIPNIPKVGDKDFIDSIKSLVNKHHIDLILPAHDEVVLKLSEKRDELPCQVVTSSKKACKIARSKKSTYEKLNGVVPIPNIYSLEGAKNAIYPLFLKPEVGQGSHGCLKVKNYDEINTAIVSSSSLMILEYLPGAEYTIDCFTNRHGKLLFVGGRSRSRIVNGISVNSTIVNDPRFALFASKLNEAIDFRGAWFFQLKERENGELVLLEIATRIAGSMELYQGLGVNFAELSLWDALGIDVQICPNTFKLELDRALSSNYKSDIEYDTVYLDFDDTITCSYGVNEEIMRFIYQAKNQKKNIVLLTRHINAVRDSLSKCHIALSLFDDIISLNDRSIKKSSVIPQNAKAIFIDDSYAERKDVLEQCHIPVFAPESVGVLIDYRA